MVQTQETPIISLTRIRLIRKDLNSLQYKTVALEKKKVQSCRSRQQALSSTLIFRKCPETSLQMIIQAASKTYCNLVALPNNSELLWKRTEDVTL